MNNDNQNYDGAIRKYLLTELKMPAWHVNNTLNSLKKYQDIYLEFCEWLDSRVLTEDGLEVEGYSARALLDIQPRLSEVAAYLLLVDLRDDAEQTLEYIKEGLPIC